MKTVGKLKTVFGQMSDFRRSHKQLHDLESILLIGIVSVVCGAGTWNEMESYGKLKEDFLRGFLKLDNGIPSHDTFNRVFSGIDPVEFEKCVVQWVGQLATLNEKEVVSIDGRTVRGAKSGGKKSPVHLVSAWANQNNLVLGQVRVNEKSNEITAIPKLLEMPALENCIVTIDAMGCQSKITRKTRSENADYILAVKNNQKQLCQDIEEEFRFGKDIQGHETQDLDHGRIETRKCSVLQNFQFVEENGKWKDLKSVVKIEGCREFKNSNRPKETAVRYYISNLDEKAKEFQTAIRSHWGVENQLHWTLDVAFGEDASRKRTGNPSQNFASLNKIALNLLKNEKSSKIGVKSRRLKAGWSNDYLMKVLSLIKV